MNTYPLRSGAVHSNDLEREIYSSGSIREIIYSALLRPDETRTLMLLQVLDASLQEQINRQDIVQKTARKVGCLRNRTYEETEHV